MEREKLRCRVWEIVFDSGGNFFRTVKSMRSLVVAKRRSFGG